MLRALLLIAGEIARAHDRWRSRAARRRPFAAELDHLHERIQRLEAENELLRARMRHLPCTRRPRYRPWQRMEILWHRARHGLSIAATARAFVLSPQTIINWRCETLARTSKLVQTNPPVNRLPELVAEIARRLKREWPRWGTRRIAGVLARLGVKASRSSVQRCLRRRPPRPARAEGADAVRRAKRGALVAKRPNHIWLLDFTRVGGFFRSVFVGAVVDAFSRKVLALCVSPGEPSAAFAARLLSGAVRDHGAPPCLVTDHGPQLTSDLFRLTLRRLGIRRRYGAIGKTGSLALIERWWRTLKSEHARGLFLYRPTRTIERQLTAYAEWFNVHRPHTALELRAPDDIHYGRRLRRKTTPTRATLEVRLLDGDRNLPVFRLRRAG